VKFCVVDKEEEKNSKKKSGKGINEIDATRTKWFDGTSLERWELSLMACSSFCQLFVHLITLGKFLFFCGFCFVYT